MAFACKVWPRASSGRIQRAACAPVRLLFTAARVSRGVSAVGATMNFPARSHSRESPCSFPWSEIRDASDRVSASHFSNYEHPYPASFPVDRHRLFVGRALDGLPPIEPGMRALHGAPHRFGGPRRNGGGVVFPPLACVIVPLAPLSRPSLDTGARFFAVRVVSPIRPVPPRPLRPHRRDTAWLFPVQGAFHRQVMRCSCSGLSTGDCAPFVPRFPPDGSLLRVFLGPARAAVATDARSGFSALRRRWLPTTRLVDAS